MRNIDTLRVYTLNYEKIRLGRDHDWLGGGDDADAYGRGPAYDTIVNAINNHGQSSVSLFGYSHGGGTVYNVAWRIENNYADSNGNTINNPYTLAFTGYIDAIANSNYLNPFPEYRRPPGSAYHCNQYQRNDSLLIGANSNGDDDVDRSYLGLDHGTIDNDEIVLDFLEMRFEQKVIRR